jgi:hypothetical protein
MGPSQLVENGIVFQAPNKGGRAVLQYGVHALALKASIDTNGGRQAKLSFDSIEKIRKDLLELLRGVGRPFAKDHI